MRALLTPPCEVVDIDGHLYLRLGDLDSAVGHEDAHEKAAAIVRKLNGALVATRPDASPISVLGDVARIDENGVTRVGLAIASSVTRVRMRAYGATVVLGNEVSAPPPDPAGRLLAAAERFALVAEVLDVMSARESDGLFRAYEVIRTDLTFPGIVRLLAGPFEQRELQRFAATINAPRHQRLKKPPSGGYMSKPEVRSYWNRLLGAWLHELEARGPRQ